VRVSTLPVSIKPKIDSLLSFKKPFGIPAISTDQYTKPHNKALPKSLFPGLQRLQNQVNGIGFFEAKSGHSWQSIEDIDASDSHAKTPYVHDIYAYLLRKEDQCKIDINFISYQNEITPPMRAVLVEWISEIHYTMQLKNESFYMAVNILDRFTEKTPNIRRLEYQLVGSTALLIAAKVILLHLRVLKKPSLFLM
jgi:hypothetical protein